MESKDLHIGVWFTFKDENEIEAVVIGFDPFEEKWVAACKDWAMGVSHLEDDDYERMVQIYDL